VALPTAKRERKCRIAQSNVLVFGDPKVGKTTLLAGMPNALVLDTENGTGFVDVFVIPTPDAASFFAAVKEVTEKPHQFSPICIDTLDSVVRFCSAEVCKQNGVKDLADLPYGKGFTQLTSGLTVTLNRLASLNGGLWLTTHVKEVEIELPDGGKAVRAEPSLSNSAARVVLAFCDFVFYMHAVDGPATGGSAPSVTRAIETKPSRRWIAGDRTGRLPAQLPCDLAVIDREFTRAIRPADPGADPSVSVSRSG
jgi:hypothetical protein